MLLQWGNEKKDLVVRMESRSWFVFLLIVIFLYIYPAVSVLPMIFIRPRLRLCGLKSRLLVRSMVNRTLSFWRESHSSP